MSSVWVSMCVRASFEKKVLLRYTWWLKKSRRSMLVNCSLFFVQSSCLLIDERASAFYSSYLSHLDSLGTLACVYVTCLMHWYNESYLSVFQNSLRLKFKIEIKAEVNRINTLSIPLSIRLPRKHHQTMALLLLPHSRPVHTVRPKWMSFPKRPPRCFSCHCCIYMSMKPLMD